jgi:hypothetical protein
MRRLDKVQLPSTSMKIRNITRSVFPLFASQVQGIVHEGRLSVWVKTNISQDWRTVNKPGRIVERRMQLENDSFNQWREILVVGAPDINMPGTQGSRGLRLVHHQQKQLPSCDETSLGVHA